MNAESSAFIVADAWFVLGHRGGRADHAGSCSGYRLLVRRAWRGGRRRAGPRRGGRPSLALRCGWATTSGSGTYNHLLASSATGASFHASLALGAKSALALWPLCTSGVILLGESGARRAAAKPRHRRQEEPAASGMWTGGAARWPRSP